MKLELYFYEQCPFCQIVLRQIQALNLQDSIEFKNTLTDSDAGKFHLQTTGRSTVPCLYIDGKPMFESRDISDWLKQNQTQIRKN